MKIVAFQAPHCGIDRSARQPGHFHHAETIDTAGADSDQDHGCGMRQLGFGGHGVSLAM